MTLNDIRKKVLTGESVGYEEVVYLVKLCDHLNTVIEQGAFGCCTEVKRQMQNRIEELVVDNHPATG